MNTITIEKKWDSENLTNRTGGDSPGYVPPNQILLLCVSQYVAQVYCSPLPHKNFELGNLFAISCYVF